MNKFPEDLDANSYIETHLPAYKEIPLDYHQSLKELEQEAAVIAERNGVTSESGEYPPWIWDKVFGD